MFAPSALVADPKARTFVLSVQVVLVIVLKFRVVVRNDLVRVRKLRIFDPSALVVVAHVLRSQAFGLNGLRPVRRKVVQHVLVVHNDAAMRLARAVGIVTRLVRVRINLRDNNPAIQPARAAGIVTRQVRVRINRSRRRDPGRPRRGVAERGLPRAKVTRASAIALREEGGLASSKNAQA
jgi:hypothetical protein